MSVVTVIVPCYNTEKYVGECIESLLASTFPLSDMEFIFVDDASTDGTCQVIRQYESRYPDNIILVECSENGRPGTARNIGLQYASGDYIMFVDSDDKIESTMISKLYDKLTEYGCDIVTCGYSIFSGDIVGKTFATEEHFYSDNLNEKRWYIVKHWWRNSACGAMYPKSFLDRYNLVFPEKIYMEDLYFSTMCTMHAKSRYVVNESLYWYRSNPDSITTSERMKDYYMDGYYLLEKAYAELVKENLIDDFRNEFAFFYYEKAFVGPVANMHLLFAENEIDMEKMDIMRKSVYEHFPDIESNPYIHLDKSEFSQMMYKLLTWKGGEKNT